MSKAQDIVTSMLEADHDEHIKAWDRIQKWDKAHSTYHDLAVQKAKAQDLFRELGRSIGYERALAHVGLTRADVSHQIYGNQIGSIDNYKQTRAVRQCANFHCRDRRPYPETQDVCPTCEEPLQTKQMRYSFSDLHGKFARYMLGVELNDGRRVWFREPLPPMT